MSETTRRTIRGESRRARCTTATPPATAPTASTATCGQETSNQPPIAATVNSAAATPLITVARKFLTALRAWMSPGPSSGSTASIRMPMPAPKYPPYTATSSCSRPVAAMRPGETA